MSEADSPDEAARRRAASSRIIAPVARALRRAGVLSVLAGALWPLQAACIATVVSGWVTGDASLQHTLSAAAGLALAGAARALLEDRARGIVFDAADTTIARERARLLRREARAPGPAGPASVAALLAQKLALLEPWITRYHVAMTRVAVLPLLLLAVTASLSWVVALVLLVAGPLIPVFMALVGMAAETASRRQMHEIGSMNDMLMDRLTALLDIRLLGAGARALRDFDRRADGLRARTMAVLRIAFLSSAVLELFAALGVAMVAVYVGFSLLGEIRFGTWGTPLTLGQGLFLLLIVPEYFQPLRDLAAAWHDRAAGLAVVAELEALEAAPRAAMLGDGGRADPLPGALSLQLQGASAALPGGPLALPDLELVAGEAVALVGPSGAGKSMTLSVLAGLVPLASGRLAVCGRALDHDCADAWRARIAVIAQRPHFADRTLRAYLDPRASGDDPHEALRLAQVQHVVDALPDGLATCLGESGGGVSGGEARRLMVARAVMAGGDLLLADEPTADLDAETAALVIDALVRLRRAGRTLVVATHDPALIAAMDRVVEVPA